MQTLEALVGAEVARRLGRGLRNGILASGMEGGMRETMDQLDELVASLC